MIANASCSAEVTGVAYEPLHVDRDGHILEDIPCSGCNRSLKGAVASGWCPDCGETIALSVVGRAVCRLDDQGRLLESLRCSSCGYDLRGIDPASACPECHVPVGQSLEGNLLRYGDYHWIKKVGDGLLLYIVALAIAVALGIGAGVLRIFIKDPAVVSLVTMATSVISGLFMIVAIWWITAPDPHTPITAQQRRGANMARLLIIPQVIAAGALGVLGAFATSSQGQVLVMLFQVPIIILAVFVGVGLLMHMREMARRVVDDKLANWARTIIFLTIIGNGLLMLSMGAIAGTALVTGSPMPAPGQQPASGMLLASIAGGLGSCTGGLIGLIATIWMIVLIFKLRKYFTSAAKVAAQRDAV